MPHLSALKPSGITEGVLSVRIELDSQGRSIIRDQRFSGALQIAKPFYDHVSGDLVLFTLNPMGGMVDQDQYNIDVSLGKGSVAVIVPASASKIYAARTSGVTVEQRLEVGDEAALEFIPDLTIPQKAARVRQRTHIVLGRRAVLFYGEILAPGRRASQESFSYEDLDYCLSIWRESEMVAMDRFHWVPSALHPRSKVLLGDYDYLMNLFMFGASPLTELADEMAFVLEKKTGVLGGVSCLESDGLVVKILLSSSVDARDLLTVFWALYRLKVRASCPITPRKY